MSAPFINWIASYPRSGNTWVRSLLLAYQYGEAFDLNRMDGIPGEPPPGYYRMLWPGKEPYDKQDWAHMRPLALRAYYETRRHKEFVLKTHTANIKLGGIPLIPRGMTNKAVYVKRDPRDVLCSCAKYFEKTHEEMLAVMMEPGHCLEDLDVWQFVSSYKNHVVGWTKEDEFPVHMVEYANLLEQPGEELTRLLEFFAPDEEVDVERVAEAVENCALSRFREIERTVGFRERPPQVTSFFGAGDWRGSLEGKMADELMDRLAS